MSIQKLTDKEKQTIVNFVETMKISEMKETEISAHPVLMQLDVGTGQ